MICLFAAAFCRNVATNWQNALWGDAAVGTAAPRESMACAAERPRNSAA
jgi:hypothetical protein